MALTVLVHGGGFDSRCWDRLLPHLTGPAIAVDLPGRGAHPLPFDQVTFAACATSVVDDIDATGHDDVVLVGHSLAGCSMPAMIDALGDRVRHAVFVACTVPPQGHSVLDTLDPEIQELARGAAASEPQPMPPEIAEIVIGNDLTSEEFAWCLERTVAESPRLISDPVDLGPLRSAMPRTWVRTTQDVILPADKQREFARNVGDCPVVDLDAGHMCMVGQAEALAGILNRIGG